MIFQHLSHCCEVLSLLAYHPEPMLDSPPAFVSQQAPRAGKGRQVGRWVASTNHRGIQWKPISNLCWGWCMIFWGLMDW